MKKYVCAFCGQSSSKMDLLKEKYYPIKNDLKKRPFMYEIGIANELLKCTCGNKNSWFSLREIN